MLKKLFKRFQSPTGLGVTLLTLTIIIIVFASRVLYQRTVALLTDNLREAIMTISVTQATNINAGDLAVLQGQEDWQKPEWQRVVNQLHGAKYSNKNVVFMYIFRKTDEDPTQMEFVADADSINPFINTENAPTVESIPVSECPRCIDVNRDGIIEPEGADKLQWPGQGYPEAVDIPEAWEAYNGPLTSSELYTDSYGTVLTGYAPIRDEDGNAVAVLATDVRADDFLTITTQTLLPFIIFIVFLTLIISTLTIVIFSIWKRYTKSLEKLNQQIAISNEKLKDLDKLKTEFLSLASHQLRSPLTAIKGYTSMLLEGSFGEVTEVQKETIDKVFQSSKHLAKVVEDLLNVTKIEQGGMVYQMAPFDMEKTVKEIVDDLKITAEKKGLVMEFSTDNKAPYTANGDMEKLRQVFLNLIDNSIKYTAVGSISVMVGKVSDKIRFSVTDTGMGMTEETKKSLFQKFARGEGGKVNASGSGLGLYLAKEIVGAHKGKVWVESPGVGKGSTFIVEL
jgi:signal transduction histidine kinase